MDLVNGTSFILYRFRGVEEISGRFLVGVSLAGLTSSESSSIRIDVFTLLFGVGVRGVSRRNTSSEAWRTTGFGDGNVSNGRLSASSFRNSFTLSVKNFWKGNSGDPPSMCSWSLCERVEMHLSITISGLPARGFGK